MIRRTKKFAPFTALYQFVGDELRVSIDRPLLERRMNSGDVAIVYRSDVVYFFYKRPPSRRWAALVYFADEKHRAALDAFVLTHRLTTQELGV